MTTPTGRMRSMIDRSPHRLYSSFRIFPRRQATLFVLAVCLPCALLLGLSARTVVQDRELARRRGAERHQQIANAIAQALTDRLERIKLEEAIAFAALSRTDGLGSENDRLVHSATVFIARVDASDVRPAWTIDARAERTERLLSDRIFAASIAAASHQELVLHDRVRAAASYDSAALTARDSAQSAYARLLRARTLASLHEPRALEEYRRILRTPLTVRDEQGIPFALYAAGVLRPNENDSERVASFSAQAAEALLTSRALSPGACYALAGTTVSPRLHARCLELDRAEMLVRDPTVLLAIRTGDTTWSLADSGRWVTSLAPATRTRAAVFLAVRLDSVLGALGSPGGAGARVVGTNGADIHALGPGLHGLGIRWSPADTGESDDVAQIVYVSMLATALSLIFLGGYLLLRDVQRELRLAQLRAQFVASISHELKTPLTSIRMYAETLRDQHQVDRVTRRELLTTIAHESDRLARLFENLLEFSMIERRTRTYHRSPHPLAPIVEQAIAALRFPLDQQGFAVRVRCEDTSLAAWCDPDAIEQALLNLVSNASKYSGASRHLEVTLTRDGDFASIAVRDRGVGISSAHQRRMFEKFYRAPTSDNEAIPGIGLGLTLVRHIAEGHGGRVQVQSVVGQGTTVTLSIPRSDRLAAVIDAPSRAPAGAAAR